MAASAVSMSRLLKLAQKFNCFYLSERQQANCRPFIVEGYQVGLVRPDVMLELSRYPDVFHIQPDSVELNPAFRDYDERSSKVEAVLKECRSNNVFVALKGWREECFEVRSAFSSHSLLKMDRSATSYWNMKNNVTDLINALPGNSSVNMTNTQQ